jgi:hypothetical protein
MKTIAIVCLLSLASVVCGAGLCFLAADAMAGTAGRDLAEFEEQAWATARKARIVPADRAGFYIVSMVPPSLDPSARVRIQMLQRRHNSLLYRRALAAAAVTGCLLAAIPFAGFVWYCRQTDLPPVQPNLAA